MHYLYLLMFYRELQIYIWFGYKLTLLSFFTLFFFFGLLWGPIGMLKSWRSYLTLGLSVHQHFVKNLTLVQMSSAVGSGRLSHPGKVYKLKTAAPLPTNSIVHFIPTVYMVKSSSCYIICLSLQHFFNWINIYLFIFRMLEGLSGQYL